jgi:hypothetical protein
MRRVHVTEMRVTGDLIDQTETGNAFTSVTLEINSGEGEWLNSDQRSTPFSEKNNRNLDFSQNSVQAPFNELNDQGGGGGGAPPTPSNEREQMFAGDNGLFDHGPVLDSNDTLNVRSEVEKNNTTYDVRVRGFYVLGWRIHEVENARPSFGIPL